MYQSNTNKSVELPTDHSASSPACLKPVAHANSNLTESCEEILCEALCLWKAYKKRLQRFGGALSQQTLTGNVSGEGHRLGERGRKSAAGAEGPAEAHGKGFEGPRARLGWAYPRLAGAVSSRVSRSHIQILTLSAALLTSTNYSPGAVPVPKAKILRRHHFVPPSIYAFHGRTGLSTT